MSIELWAARLERPLTERETTAMLRLLPEARRERLLRIKQPEKRREPLCAYLILRHALWEQYRWQELPEIRLSSFGKPYFPEHPDVHFNLSHTAGAVLVGLSDRPVGVDIEHIRPVSQRTMRRLADVGTERAFFQSWVRREARADLAKWTAKVWFEVKLAAVFLPAAVAMGARDDKLVAALAMLASPTTVSSFVMARSMGHEGTLTSSTVMLTTLFSIFTLTLWLYILRTMGLI